jgi:hypothetical protein
MERMEGAFNKPRDTGESDSREKRFEKLREAIRAATVVGALALQPANAETEKRPEITRTQVNQDSPRKLSAQERLMNESKNVTLYLRHATVAFADAISIAQKLADKDPEKYNPTILKIGLLGNILDSAATKIINGIPNTRPDGYTVLDDLPPSTPQSDFVNRIDEAASSIKGAAIALRAANGAAVEMDDKSISAILKNTDKIFANMEREVGALSEELRRSQKRRH